MTALLEHPAEAAINQAGDLSYIFRRVGLDLGRLVFRQVEVRPSLPWHGDVAITVLDPLLTTSQFVRPGTYVLAAELRKGESNE